MSPLTTRIFCHSRITFQNLQDSGNKAITLIENCKMDINVEFSSGRVAQAPESYIKRVSGFFDKSPRKPQIVTNCPQNFPTVI